MADLFLEKSQHVECSDPEAFRRDMASIVNRARETTLKLSKVCSSQSVLGCGDFWGTGRGCSCGGKGCPSCGGKGMLMWGEGVPIMWTDGVPIM